ncbi:hypothetical protein CB0940_05641 [Cercospora beticola]|uniref:2EXR domain-containing protein n=1 Tax=Cercospora beticola TaxID=122368 RepID=A0A2G5HZY4_CERBT|nr:hypothetical protein CB0940_05641 [Cercospora beticola]PIA98117.1 hypothetical protein CB0940_05641 [Cercospora beticola]WPA98209.1 hypothetical protein RHO25_002821 [Cercospora beticola]CAK1359432.1 unnamed protein product [Cercospora beticola]
MSSDNKTILDCPLESQSADSNMAVGGTTTANTVLDTAVNSNECSIQEAPAEPKLKGFMRLPAEIRLQIYEDLFTPSPGIIAKCHPAEQTCRLTPAKISTDLANTTPLSAISTRRTYGCHCDYCKFSSALLLTNHQICSEAAPVLESTFQFGLNLKMEWWQFTWAKFDLESTGLWGLKDDYTQNVPKFVKVCVIHFDYFEPESILEMDSMRQVARDLAFLHHLADQVKFVVEVHIALAFEERQVGWSEAVSEKSEASEQFVTEQETKAQEMKAELIEGLMEEFELKEKKFRMLDGE